MKNLIPLFFLFMISCGNNSSNDKPVTDQSSGIELVVLGIAQDAGFPQASCEKENCKLYWERKEEKRNATSLGLIDHSSGKYWLFEATPDFKFQLRQIQQIARSSEIPSGIFLTHAHIGHYTGLMHVGHEVMGASGIPVYTMPRMKNYLETNGPWKQLVDYENIALQQIKADSAVQLSESIKVTPFLVPHRDEYSETVGYKIETENKSLLFIPDINKWGIWDRAIIEEISKVDYAFLDATFFDSDELPGRDISEIPHPFVEESIDLFQNLTAEEKQKVYFIHFNHTNPLILDSPERKEVEALGFKVAYEGMKIELE
jgi:pyrroloquinoline quinone biosynthesis protein B